MRKVEAQKVAVELKLPVDIVWNELLSETAQMEKKSTGKYFLVDEQEKAILVFNFEDGKFIADEGLELKMIGLADHFQVDKRIMHWILRKLSEKGAFSNKVVTGIEGTAGQPTLLAWFEPAQVDANEETTLIIEISAPDEIEEPKLTLDVPESLELEYRQALPPKIGAGKRFEKYRYRTTKNGKYQIPVSLEGMSQAIQINEQKVSDPLIVKALPPEVYAELRSGRQEINATFQKDCTISLSVNNKGKGDAQKIEIKGLDKYSEFSTISSTRIGYLAAHARSEHPLIIKPRKSGQYTFDKLTLAIEDLDEKSFEAHIPTFIIDVNTPQPKVKVKTITPQSVKPSEIFSIRVVVSNSGEGEARNVKFNLPIDNSLVQSGRISFFIPKLTSGDMEEEQISLRAPSKGKMAIGDFSVQLEDIEGTPIKETIEGEEIRSIEGLKGKPEDSGTWPFTIGATIDRGKLKIERELGEGGFSKVYLARNRVTEEDRAIKALRPDYVNNASLVEDFIREAKISSKLMSRNIVKVYDIEMETQNGIDFPYIVMEYLEGVLEEMVSPGTTMEFIRSMMVIQDIYVALDYAHKNGYLHCDIKPSNIFFDKEETAWKLGDFGLAKLARKEGLSRRGTIEFMAPEVRQKGEVSAASDVYSLGMVFKWLLAGETQVDLRKMKKEESVPKDRWNKIVDMIEKMTSTKPADRPTLQEVWKLVRWSISGA